MQLLHLSYSCDLHPSLVPSRQQHEKQSIQQCTDVTRCVPNSRQFSPLIFTHCPWVVYILIFAFHNFESGGMMPVWFLLRAK